jgi:hypothetical protein
MNIVRVANCSQNGLVLSKGMVCPTSIEDPRMSFSTM